MYKGDWWAIGHGGFDVFNGLEGFGFGSRGEIDVRWCMLRELEDGFLSETDIAYREVSECCR